MPISMTLILTIVMMAIMMLIAMPILGVVSDSIICPVVTENQINQLVEECQKAKDNMWILMAILPIAMFFMIFAILGGITTMPTFFNKKVKSSSKRTKNISISTKILLYLGLAKLKERR